MAGVGALCAWAEMIDPDDFKPGYIAPNLIQLADTSTANTITPYSFENSFQRLKYHINNFLCILEREKGKNIEKFTIGKSTTNKGDSDFNPLDFTTWGHGDYKTGVWSRWTDYKQKTYNGLVVLCAITKELLPEKSMLSNIENYAYALEQRLIKYYAYEEKDIKDWIMIHLILDRNLEIIMQALYTLPINGRRN